METKTIVHPVMIDYKCPKCDIGYLRPTGTVFACDPPHYPHSCNNPNCYYGETIRDKQYPYIEYEPVNPIHVSQSYINQSVIPR